jgi:hypothetical protein
MSSTPSAPSQDQLEVMSALVKATFGDFEKLKSLSAQQLEIMRQIAPHYANIAESTSNTRDNIEAARDALSDANEEAEESKSIFEQIADAAKGAAAAVALAAFSDVIMKVLTVAVKAAMFAIEKLWSAIKALFSLMKSAISIAFDFAGALFDVGKAILSIPFDAYNWLIGKANDLMSGGGSEYAQAIHDLKKEYGALDQVAPSTIMNIARNTSSLKEVGISAYRVYGNLGERLKAMLEFAQKMGPTFENFAEEIGQTGMKIPALSKAMGILDDQLPILGQRAKTMGTSLQDQYVRIHKQSWNLNKAYGFATKYINRDIVKAMGDVKRFGGATEEQLGAASVYARSLGTELEKIAGILDAFETFEGAADAVSKIAQTFQVQLDPTALLNSQDAADAVEQIRLGFRAAGKDASTFKRHEIDLLSQVTKLPPEITKQVFSLKNQGKSLKEITETSEAAGKTFSTLETALHDLRKSIEFLVKSGSMPKGGFLDMWIAGIQRGIDLHPLTRGLFRDVARDLKMTYYDARRVLNAFIKDFPGVEQMIKGLREIFNPKVFGGFIKSINNTIIKFFKDFAAGKATFTDLLNGLKENFSSFFGKASSGGSKFLSGLETFGKNVARLAGEIIEWIGGAIASGIDAITKIVDKPDAALGAAKDALGEVGKVATSLWDPISDGISKAADSIGAAFGRLFDVILKKFPEIQQILDLFKSRKITDKDRKAMGWDTPIGLGWSPDVQGAVDETILRATENMTGIEIKLRSFWKEILDQFNSFTNSSFFEGFKAVVDLLISAIYGLTTAIFASGIASLFKTFGGGIKGAAGLVLGGTAAGFALDGLGLGIDDIAKGSWNALTNLFSSEEDKGNTVNSTVNANIIVPQTEEQKQAEAAVKKAKGEGNILDIYTGESPKIVKSVLLPGQIDLKSALSLQTVSDAMGALTEEVAGGARAKSSIMALVDAIKEIDKKIGKDSTVSSAKRVAEFFGHVKNFTEALSGIQGLVQFESLSEDANDNSVITNFTKIERILGLLTGGNDSLLSLIAGHISTIAHYAPSSQITESVATFFDHLEKIALNLRGIAGAQIDAGPLNDSLDSFIVALSIFRARIPPLMEEIRKLNTVLTGFDRNDRRSKMETLKILSQNLLDFTSHFESIKGSLSRISSMSKAFTGSDPDAISSEKINTAITGVSDVLINMFTGKRLPDSKVTSPYLKTLEDAVTPLFTDSKDRVNLKGGVTKFSKLSTGLGTLNSFLTKMNDSIEGGKSGISLLGNLKNISEFFTDIGSDGETGKSMIKVKSSAINTFIDELTKIEKATKENFAGINSIGPLLAEGKVAGYFNQIISLIDMSKGLSQKLVEAKSGVEQFNEATLDIARTAGIGGDYDLGTAHVEITVNVNIQIKASAIEKLIITAKESIVRDRLNFALDAPDVRGATIPASGITTQISSP